VTNINIYCLFNEEDALHGVYSSIKAVHRDALKICNRGISGVFVRSEGGMEKANIAFLRTLFKGEMDKKVKYISDYGEVTILKTGLRE
jgi:hypothetical protein|tara:strand:- start:1383 stop:1646 length:264 start_codon:yes stop_codon:yes gene_type:complete